MTMDFETRWRDSKTEGMPRPTRSDHGAIGKTVLGELYEKNTFIWKQTRTKAHHPSLKIYIWLKHLHSAWVFDVAKLRGGWVSDRPLFSAYI